MATPVVKTEAPKEVIKYIEVERKESRPTRFNVWASVPKDQFEYVTIPKEDLHGYPYPPVSVNFDKFDEYHNSYIREDEAGRTFLVPPILAGELRRIMDRFHIESVALLQPKRRLEALRNLAGNPSATRVATAAAGSTAQSVGIPGAVLPTSA